MAATTMSAFTMHFHRSARLAAVPSQFFCQLASTSRRLIDHHHRSNSVVHHVTHREFAHFVGSEQQHPAVFQRAEDIPRQFKRSRWN